MGKEKHGHHFRSGGTKNSPDVQFCGRQHLGMSHSKAHLEQMMKDLIEEAERWDREPKPASL